MMLRKYFEEFKTDLASVGYKKEDFKVEPIYINNVLEGLTIKFRDTKFVFTITKDPSEFRNRFYGKFVGYFPPNFEERSISAFIHPGIDIQGRIRYWINEHINIYLEEIGRNK